MKTKAEIDHDYWFRKKAKRKISSIPDIEGEIWKCVLNYEGLYIVSNKGRVKSVDRISFKRGLPYEIPSKLLSTGGGGNYLQVTLFREGIRYYHLVHRLVCIAFHKNPENKPEVNHKDGNKHNNNDWNLEWSTKSENCTHAIETGLRDIKGGKHFNAKKIGMYTIDDLLIEEFDCIADAMRKNNFKTMISIINTARGIRDNAYGYKWKYL